MASVRGTSFLGTLEYVRTTFGEDGLVRVEQALSAPVQALIANSGRALLPHAWYDLAALSELTRTIDRVLGKGDLALARSIGKHVAFSDVNRFFRWLFRLAGPGTLFPRASSVWKNYYDTGRYVVEDVKTASAAIRIEEWDATDDVLCKRLEGWIERALELTIGEGTNPVISETHHRAHDRQFGAGAYCRFEARW